MTKRTQSGQGFVVPDRPRPRFDVDSPSSTLRIVPGCSAMSRSTPDPNASLRIDAYLGEARPFAGPILITLRELVARTHPELEEDWKWGAPAFHLRGTVCLLQGFRRHVSLTFPRGSELDDWADAFESRPGIRFNRTLVFRRVEAIREEVVLDYAAQACALNLDGPARSATPRPEIEVVVPPELARALRGNSEAASFFSDLAPGYRRDYCRWISDAKRPETRSRRLARTLEALQAGEKSIF